MTEASGTYIRRKSSIDDNFQLVRNEWVRDPSIVGNPLSLYLYLRSHSIQYRITRVQAMKELALGKDAYRAAEQRLINAGYLREAPATPIVGKFQSKTYEVLDPHENTPEGQNQSIQSGAENPPRQNNPVDNSREENPPWVEIGIVDNHATGAENPQRPGRIIRPLKKIKRRLINNSYPVKPVNVREKIEKAVRLFDGTEKPTPRFLEKITASLQEVQAGLDANSLVDELNLHGLSWGEISGIDLVRAVQQIKAKASGIVLRYPVKYFAAAIAKHPDAYPRAVYRPDPFDCGSGVHEVSHWLEVADVVECRSCGTHITDVYEKELLIRLSSLYQARQLKGVI